MEVGKRTSMMQSLSMIIRKIQISFLMRNVRSMTYLIKAANGK